MTKFIVIAKKSTFWEIVEGKQKRISKARFEEVLTQKIVKTEKRETETVYHVEEREKVELVSFAELSEVVQKRIIAGNRNLLVDDGFWYQYQKDKFHQTLELLGFSNIDSNFTGFYSQGDGASFTATWDAVDVVNNPELWESDEEYKHFKPFMDELSQLGGTAEVLRISGSIYVHEYTCFTCAENLDAEYLLERLRVDCCTKYYRNLLAEYNYLTSDAALNDYYLDCDYLKYTQSGLCVNNSKG